MVNDDKVEYINYIHGELNSIKDLFLEKTKQYATDDPLDDFRRGAYTEFMDGSYISMFKVLRGYVLKHITQLFKPLGTCKQDECLRDIILYCFIALYMIKKHKEMVKND